MEVKPHAHLCAQIGAIKVLIQSVNVTSSVVFFIYLFIYLVMLLFLCCYSKINILQVSDVRKHRRACCCSCVCVCRNVGSKVNLTFGPGRRGDVNPEFLNEVVISRRKDDADLLGNYSVFI